MSSDEQRAAGAGLNEESEEQKRKREAIMAIMRDGTLTAQEKNSKIHQLMNPTSSKPAANQDAERPQGLTEEEKKPTYNPKTGTLGCEHYQRDCKLKAKCCQKYFTCLRCHDETNDHMMIRYDIETILCMHCGTEQTPTQNCQSCGKQLGKYFCEVCRFYDNDEKKEIYHCPHCRICRIGKGLGIDFEHCKTCNTCLQIGFAHTCVESCMHVNCPICQQYIFTSTLPVKILPRCGHTLHVHCYEKYIRTKFGCPICQKSIWDPKVPEIRAIYDSIDQEIAAQPMPEEFRDKLVSVLCNDCSTSFTTNFHFIGHRCPNTECRSYNTRIIKL